MSLLTPVFCCSLQALHSCASTLKEDWHMTVLTHNPGSCASQAACSGKRAVCPWDNISHRWVNKGRMSQTGEQGLWRGERGKHLSPDTAASAARGGNNNLESSPLSRSYPRAPHIPTDWDWSGSTPKSLTILGISRCSLRSSSYTDRSWIRRSHH